MSINSSTQVATTITEHDRAALAAMIFYTFGGDIDAAITGWNRLFASECSTAEFLQLVSDNETKGLLPSRMVTLAAQIEHFGGNECPEDFASDALGHSYLDLAEMLVKFSGIVEKYRAGEIDVTGYRPRQQSSSTEATIFN